MNAGLLFLSVQHVSGRRKPNAPDNETRIKHFRAAMPAPKYNDFDWQAVRASNSYGGGGVDKPYPQLGDMSDSTATEDFRLSRSSDLPASTYAREQGAPDPQGVTQ